MRAVGIDSAPHPVAKKLSVSGIPGIFNAPVCLAVYAKVFEEEGALDRLEAVIPGRAEGASPESRATCCNHDIPSSGVYIRFMTTVEDIEKAIEKLKPRELDRLRAWLEEFQAARFDEKIERDAKGGKLDRLADRALDDHRKGRSREL